MVAARTLRPAGLLRPAARLLGLLLGGSLDGLLGRSLGGSALLLRLGAALGGFVGHGGLLDLGGLVGAGAAAAALAVFLADFALGVTGSRTSSITAMGALSPLRLPTFVMRV
nr:hypothetical protein GCM10025699_03180 [Microbacterium flavescens]